MEIGDDGLVSVYVGSANKGQGLETALSQIAADALGVSLESIRILHGSTTYLKEGFGSFHSRSTVMGGSAILIAAAMLREKIREATAASGGKTLTLAELGALKIQVTGEFPSEQRTYGYGAAAAHVTVDTGTGKVELVDYFTVQDIGRVINPMTAKGQLVGAVVQGLGGVFLEHMIYDAEGQLLTGSLADYLMPSAGDYPRIRADVLENSPSPSNPLGAKGVGEGGIVPVGAVVSNAVAAALSSLKVEPTALPLTPPQVWALINPHRNP
jgi:carbon-monoxide dehydrogenase large subunit